MALAKTFITWIEILLKNQFSCVMNGRTTIQYFNLETGARQYDLISAYPFILPLEMFLYPEIKDIKTFEHFFLYTIHCTPS